MKTIKPTQQFRNCFFEVVLSTFKTDFDFDTIHYALFAWVNNIEGFNLLGFKNEIQDKDFFDTFAEYVGYFNHMGLKTIEDAQIAHDQYWNDLEEEDIELLREDAIHMKGERQMDRERE